ncbi:MAG: peptidase M13 [Candidatus Ancillula sp.]|jgi:putative endopeptidase|nr:peptidase M13 [Candidatus Ancillula sp.]
MSIRIQDDLFRAVNQDWLDNNEIPADKPRWGSFDILNEESLNIQKELLEDKSLNEQMPLAQTYYNSFMNKDAIEEAGAKRVVEILEEVEKIDNWDSLVEILTKNYAEWRLMPFRAGLGNDLDNPDYYTLHIAQGGILLPDESYYKEESKQQLRQAYVNLQQGLFDIICRDTEIKINAKQVDEFCAKIANLHKSSVELRDVQANHNPIKFSEAVRKFGNLQLSKCWNLSDDLVIDVNQPDFIAGILEFWNFEEFDNWKNWVKANIAGAFTPYLNQEIEDQSFKMGQLFSGVQKQPDRWKRGVSFVSAVVGDEVGKVYVDKYFGEEARKQMKELVDNLIKAYHVSISKVGWLSEETKEKALVKLSKFRAQIGFPEHWHDYSGLEFGDDIFDNNLALLNFAYHRDIKKIGNLVDKKEWLMTPQTVNAYYNPPENVIVFPAAILQSPFFDPSRDPAENYGGIGAVIGHEIGHGFDDQGSQFDGDGNLKNWWTEQDNVEFKKLTDKLNNQFDKFIPQQLENDENAKDLHVKGALTTGENVGDVSGLKIALLAYALSRGFSDIEELLQKDVEEIKKFFIAFGVIWRGKSTDDFAKLLLTIDPHSPAEFRANTVRNLDAFQEAFDVKPGDGMYLDKSDRVDIW